MEAANMIEARNGKDSYKYITPYTLNGVLSGGGVGSHRIGDVIISTNSENPSIKFGGKWQLLCPGRTLVCIDTSQTEFNTVRKTGGAKTHALSVNEMPSHKHSTTWRFTGGANSAYAISWTNAPWQGPYDEALGAFTMGNTGGNAAHNNLQPFFTVYIWEKVAD